MLALTDENLKTLQTVAAPIEPKLRGRLLEAVAEACRGRPDLGPGEFHRIAHTCARRVMRDRGNGQLSDGIEGRR
jgi:hypothetical protein